MDVRWHEAVASGESWSARALICANGCIVIRLLLEDKVIDNFGVLINKICCSLKILSVI